MKTIILLASFSIFGMACADPNMKNLEAKLEESKCKTEFSQFVLENGINIMVLAKEKGFEAELDNFQKSQNDTLVSCSQLKEQWDKLSTMTIK